MTNVNLFEIATRSKYRFPFRGLITIEDLWALNLDNLNVVYQALEAESDLMPKKSLFKIASDESAALENKIAIVKYIAEVKMFEAQERRKDAADKERRQKIMALIDEKKDADLRSKTIEELQKMLKE